MWNLYYHLWPQHLLLRLCWEVILSHSQLLSYVVYNKSQHILCLFFPAVTLTPATFDTGLFHYLQTRSVFFLGLLRYSPIDQYACGFAS